MKKLQEQYPDIPFDIDAVINLALQLASTIGIAIFVFGLILTIVCFAGLFGSCCNNACLLYTYFGPARQAFNASTAKYMGLKGANAESLWWNLIQQAVSLFPMFLNSALY
ncbi:hypothetical protein Ciccas_001081 [Cichlidogyrus casuarinus]|uniref:Uncharacterized protein n=1 Tax=Cichlidogyrus casuarinus TaxID=1844966 RepID=A0ABD2QL28_9PLAT